MKVFVFECTGKRKVQYIIYGRSPTAAADKLCRLTDLRGLYAQRKYFTPIWEKPEFYKLEGLLKHLDAGKISFEELSSLDISLEGFRLVCVDVVSETKRPVDELAEEFPEALVVM